MKKLILVLGGVVAPLAVVYAGCCTSQTPAIVNQPNFTDCDPVLCVPTHYKAGSCGAPVAEGHSGVTCTVYNPTITFLTNATYVPPSYDPNTGEVACECNWDPVQTTITTTDGGAPCP